MFTVEVDFSDSKKILRKLGLNEGGPVQNFFANELMRKSDPYVPMDSTTLKGSARVVENGKFIEYNTPYARYHWYGKLAVDPKTGKGAFKYTDKLTGNVVMFSRPGVRKTITDKDMIYQGAPLRGPKWVERCWIDNKSEIIKSVEKYIGGSK